MDSVNKALGDIVVGVLTYKRPDDLRALLPMVAEHCQQVAPLASSLSILVVDNDAEESGRQAVAELALPEVRYVVEPQPGIAAARNRVLDEVKGAHLLVFIDDDERPQPRWLSSLVECYQREHAVAVTGAVVPDAGRIEDPWIVAGGFFVRKRFPTGTEQAAAGTGNLLLDLRQIEAMGGVRFDTRFGLTGGSDTMFTRTLRSKGGRIVWCDESVVVDHIPAKRLTREWVLQRRFRTGNLSAQVELDLADGFFARLRVRLEYTILGALRIVVGTLLGWFGTLTGSLKYQARGARGVARGRGMVSGAWGGTYVEYRRKESGG